MADVTDLIFLAGGQGGDVAALIPDVIVDVKHTFTNTVSTYAIEKSTDGAFNGKVDNNKINITGVFVEPYIEVDDLNDDSTAFRFHPNPLAGSTPSVLPDAITSKSTRKQEAFNKLKEARDKAWFLDIVTGLETYEDCLITSLVIIESKDTGNVLNFTLDLVQTRFTTSAETLELNIVSAKTDSATTPKKSSGEVKEVTPRGIRDAGSTMLTSIFGG